MHCDHPECAHAIALEVISLMKGTNTKQEFERAVVARASEAILEHLKEGRDSQEAIELGLVLAVDLISMCNRMENNLQVVNQALDGKLDTILNNLVSNDRRKSSVISKDSHLDTDRT